MTTISHNKLVRDKIPEIIAAGGATPKTRILTDEEFACAIDRRIIKETEEK